MSTGAGAAAPQLLPIDPGRYLMPRPRRWFLTVLAPCWVVYMSWQWAHSPDVFVGWGEGFAVALYVMVLGTAATSWAVPMTVVDQWGVHRPFRLHRHIPWADVYGLHVAGPGRLAWVSLELAGARSVVLLGVPVSALPVTPGGPSARQLYQPRQLAPSRPTDADSDPWRNPHN